AGLQPLLDQVAGAALGALFRNRLAPRNEVAVRVAAAAVKRLAALRAPLYYFAFRTVRAGNSDGLLLHVLALRLIAACGELSEAAVLQHQIVAALRAFLFQRHIGFLLLSADSLGGLAIRISGTGVELAESALL